jgi:intraflagellar transport protein 80
MALYSEDFNAAEVAYAALDETAKVQQINRIKEIDHPTRKLAEIQSFKKQFDEAENILLAKGLVYWAIRLRLDLHQWLRALELATKYKEHLDIVLWKRCEFLKDMNRRENLEGYLTLSQEVNYHYHLSLDID